MNPRDRTASMARLAGGQHAALGPLSLATVLAFAFGLSQTQHLLERTGAEAAPRLPVFDNVMEWRPQAPPPWVDVDQLSPDEADEARVLASDGGELSGSRNSESRARPER